MFDRHCFEEKSTSEEFGRLKDIFFVSYNPHWAFYNIFYNLHWAFYNIFLLKWGFCKLFGFCSTRTYILRLCFLLAMFCVVIFKKFGVYQSLRSWRNEQCDGSGFNARLCNDQGRRGAHKYTNKVKDHGILCQDCVVVVLESYVIYTEWAIWKVLDVLKVSTVGEGNLNEQIDETSAAAKHLRGIQTLKYTKHNSPHPLVTVCGKTKYKLVEQ